MTLKNDALTAAENSFSLLDIYALINERADDSDLSVILPTYLVEPHFTQLLQDGYRLIGANRNQIEISWHPYP
jgi:hypothetical protein